MSRIVVAILSLLAGIALGAAGAFTMGGGGAMGVGVATGLSTGICSVVEAAGTGGFLTAEQIDALLLRAREALTDQPLPEGTELAGSGAECAALCNAGIELPSSAVRLRGTLGAPPGRMPHIRS